MKAVTALLVLTAKTLCVADNRIHFDIAGPGEIVATDNGDPTSFELFQSHDRKAFNGLFLAIVRGKDLQAGNITVTATADGLKPGTATIKTALGTGTDIF